MCRVCGLFASNRSVSKGMKGIQLCRSPLGNRDPIATTFLLGLGLERTIDWGAMAARVPGKYSLLINCGFVLSTLS